MARVSRVERHFETLKESLPKDRISRGKVIVVGGGNGHMSFSLARLLGPPQILNSPSRISDHAVIGYPERLLGSHWST
ncbi:hypothetical protein IQ07DRAFT_647760 [Pyrenochaeta sp. DS3sAY3a]|nr:hypothetical protein IQ07DRAFT_647760 [Pyrenochaeta sp. DS3sAY3a]